MPVLVAAAIGVGAGVGAAALGAGAVAATVVGVGAAVIAHESGAADWVFDNIVEPVGKAVENVLTSDIGQFVVKAAALVTGNAWAIPLIDGAATIANGGSFGDALKSAAISYVGGKVGQLGGELASQAMVKAGASEFATQVVSSAAGSGAGRASVALIMGQDPVQAFIQGGISGGLGAAAGWLETNTEGAFSRLPTAARNVITSGLSAALTGKELTPDLVWNALLTSEGVTKTVNTFLGENLGLADRLTDNQLSALTLGIQRTTATAFSGGDVPQAILSELSRYGEQEFGKWIDDSNFGDKINNTLDKITGDYQRAQAQAEKMDGVVQAHSGAVSAYNSTVQEINAGVAEQERLRTLYERALQNFQANESQTNAEALEAAVKAFNNHVNAFNERYENTLKPNLTRYEQQVADLEAQFEVEAQTYDAFVSDLSVSAERVAEELKPVYSELDRTFVRFMNPDFNEAEYRQIAGLDADEDAYLHWLTTGKEQGLPTNAADYDAAYNAKFNQILQTTLERNGLTLGDVSKTQLDAFVQDIKSRYPNYRSLDMAPQYTLADEFAEDYNLFLRGQEALQGEARDMSDLISGYEYAKNNNIDGPVITNDVAELLRSVGIDDFIVGERLIQSDIDALNTRVREINREVAVGDVTFNDISRADISDVSIGSGQARATYNPDTGLWDWNDVTDLDNWSAAFWSPELGRMVRQYAYYKTEGTQAGDFVQGEGLPPGVGIRPGLTNTDEMVYYYKDAVTGEWVMNPSAGGISIGGSGYQFDTRAQGAFETSGVGQTLADLRDTAPIAFIEQTGQLSAEAASIIAAQVGDSVVDFARNATEYASTLDAVQSDEFKNTAGIALEAGGELLSSFNQLVMLANINPASTPLGAFARDMVALGGDTKTPEWQAAVRRMNDRMAEGEGWERIASVWGGFQEAPVQFLAEVIGKEILQEVPVLLASGGTGTIVKAGLRAAGEEVAQRMATRAAIGAGATLDLAESFGGAAESAYDEAFAAALNTGMSQPNAEAYARDVAISAGMIGATTTLVSMGIMDGNAFERAILAREGSGITAEAFDLLARRVSEGANVTWKEGVQESIEEGLPTLFTETVLTQIDPNRDVLGSVLQAATLGAVAGSGTAGGIYTGYATADALIRTNATVRNAIAGGGADPEAARAALVDLGLTDAVAQNNLLSTVNDQFHSNGDVSRAFSAHPDFRVTNADILNGVLNSAGQDVTTYVNTYVDQRYVDIEEVKAAAAAEGVTLTDEQAQDMVTQTDDPNATQAALYSIQQKYDPQGVTEQEARDAFAEQGFDPTPEQLSQFMREGPESDILNELSQFVDVNQVTEEEARQYFADIGYTPTDEEVAQFVRQQAETEVQSELDTYVDPRMVDADEVRAAYEALGLSRPADADIEALVGQYDETDLAARAEENLPKAQFNSLQMQLEEFRQALENGGVPSDQIEQIIADTREQTRADLEALGYQFDEDIGELRDEIANSEQRLLDQIAANEEAGMTRDQAIQTAVDELATEFGVAREDIFTRIGETEQSLNDRISGVETAVEDLGTQLGDVETALLDQIAANEDAGMARDEALNAAIDEVAQNLNTTRDDLLQQIGQTEQSLLDQLAEVQTGLEGQLGDVEASLLGRVQELEDSGIARDTALQTALDELATELGVTEESLLDQIGETEQSLLDQIGGVQEQIGNVEETLLSKVQELEDSGIARDEALQTALSELADQLGVTETTLLAQMGETAQSLQDQLTGLETTTQADLDFISALIGKPARDVTQVDIDFVADLIAQQEVITDLNMSQRQYDVTGDGMINQDDFALLEQALAGTDVTFAPGSMFGPATGLYAQNQANLDAQLAAEAETQALIDQQTQTQTQLATQLQTQLQTQDEMARRRAFGDFVRQQQDLYGQRVDVRTPDPMRINYFYDWQSIFATPQQSSLFPSPYAEGGQVEGTTDKLLRIIGELE